MAMPVTSHAVPMTPPKLPARQHGGGRQRQAGTSQDSNGESDADDGEEGHALTRDAVLNAGSGLVAG